jgi:hypothetical protein
MVVYAYMPRVETKFEKLFVFLSYFMIIIVLKKEFKLEG